MVRKLEQGIYIDNPNDNGVNKNDKKDIKSTSFVKTAGNLFGGIDF